MSNILFSVFALVLGSLPESDAVLARPELSVATVFQNANQDPIFQPLTHSGWLSNSSSKRPVIRGQSGGGIFETPPMSAPLGSPEPAFPGLSPYTGGTDPALPYINDPGPTIISGINGSQPHRLGFTPIFNATYIAASGFKDPGQGNMDVQEYDGGLRHTAILGPDWVFTNTAQGGARLWSGPQIPDLPGSLFRLGWDFMLNTPQAGPWSAQFDFNPSINSDFHSGLTREGVNLDGSATAFYRVSPQLLLVLGVQYWDRVDKILIPNAGVVWNPNDRLEVRLLFPKSRIGYFLGNFGDASHWLYASGEYHVESYQISAPDGGERGQVQISDWRFAVGLRSDHTWYDKFVEVGYVFDRRLKFKDAPIGDLTINNGIMARFGIQF